MKKRTTFLVLSIVILGFFTIGLVVNINPDSKSPVTPNYTKHPEVVSGPQLNGPLSVINESFESTTFPPAGWLCITPTSGTGYARQTLGTTPVPGFNGGTIYTPVGGGTALAFCNYQSGSANGGSSGIDDQWLITPQITNVQANDSLSFWLWKFGNYKDNMIIRLSTTTPTVAGMTIRIDSIGSAAADSGWVLKKYKIGNLVPAGSNIYIGFREWVLDCSNDGASYCVDLVSTSTITSVSQVGTEIPSSYNLSQNYPNPFNPETKINFALPKSGYVSLKVYDVLGKEVKTLINDVKGAGTYSVSFNASSLPSGTYIYKLESNGYTSTKKMFLVK